MTQTSSGCFFLLVSVEVEDLFELKKIQPVLRVTNKCKIIF